MKVFSLPSQMRRNVEFAQSLGFEVPDAFVFTEVFTGTKGDRPGLNKIKELIEARQIDALIVYNADRFFRNRIEAYLMRKFMQKYNVELYYAEKGRNELPSLVKPYTAISLASKADANHKNRWIEANAITLRFGGELLAYFAKQRMIPELQSIIAVLHDECRANGVDDLLKIFVNVIVD